MGVFEVNIPIGEFMPSAAGQIPHTARVDFQILGKFRFYSKREFLYFASIAAKDAIKIA